MSLITFIIDMQVDYFAHERLARNRASLVANINRVVSMTRAHGSEVIWVKTEFAPDLHDALTEMRKKRIHVVIRGTPGAELLPELDYRATDVLLIKKRYSAFFGTGLEERLRTRGCSKLIVCGINTHACVRTTVIDAYQRDLDVILAEGCIDSHDAEHHAISWRYMNGKLAEVLTVEQLSTLLTQPQSLR
jgi:nicotinamidase-related amidase